MIPKTIHYCWFGSEKMSELELKCIASWKKFLPDYTFQLWNEENFEIGYCEFTREAYRLGKFAFVSDVARIYALKHVGGIYLDTDMLLLKSLDNLLENDFFIGEYKPKALNAAIIGSIVGHSVLINLLEYYQRLDFNWDRPKTIPDIFDEIIWALPHTQVKIFPPEYFYPLSLKNKDQDYSKFIVSNSYTVHLWNHSWKDEFSLLKEFKFLASIQLLSYHLYRFPSLYFNQDYLIKYITYSKRMVKQYLYMRFKS
ncbi:glycosyltransferase [Algoriphagus persicinus]|uniref:glycosyltransferase n=1 Tax=Algoriphagus persicinus TaxID=3108754 RepID=UPI002B3A64EC|nr:glycosyltransferase [Algoriphagus sp. E1-3-M2]MEB2784739.1 glycosyltransferase [Algoriphagus sp. E1-3-M2]